MAKNCAGIHAEILGRFRPVAIVTRERLINVLALEFFFGLSQRQQRLKVTGSELKQRRWDLAMRIAGPEALGWEGEGFTTELMQGTRDWLRSRANSIEGGTSEIQLNIIAKRVLDLG